MARYVLSPLAQRDVEEIWNYTATQWGIQQAELYVHALQAAIETVAAHPEKGRTCDEIRKGYRKYPAGAHVVFYRLHHVGVDVVRILHKRMDFALHV